MLDMISIFLNLLRLVLWPTLENVTRQLKQCILLFWCGIFCIYIYKFHLVWCVTLDQYFLNDFMSEWSKDVSEVLKSLTNIVFTVNVSSYIWYLLYVTRCTYVTHSCLVAKPWPILLWPVSLALAGRFFTTEPLVLCWMHIHLQTLHLLGLIP